MKTAAVHPTPPRHVDYLLLGGGLASVTAAETLRNEGAKGSIVIVSNESVVPYNRPPLSKGFLFGRTARARLAILGADEYERLGIELLLDCSALSVKPAARLVETDRCGTLHYDELLIATGTSAIELTVPGAKLAGVHGLRTVADAQALRDAAKSVKSAVVIGGSFNGLEIASTLTLMGLKVTLIDQEATLFTRLNAPSLSRFFADHIAAKGVAVVLGETVAELRGRNRVQQVVTASGKVFDCGLVAVAVGVTPNVEFLGSSGLKVGDGLCVDKRLEAAPHIHAAGDVARFDDPIFGCARRVEHWDNAVKQGQLAARNMLGARQSFDEVTYFYSDFFDLSFEVLGDCDVVDQRIERGSLAQRSMALFYLNKNVPQALFTIGRPAAETRAAEALIRYRVNVQAMRGQLADSAYPLDKIPNQTVLILQGGGALGAFECGVVKALEKSGVYPDIVAGVSIGAFNGAIIASNPKHATQALEAFWNDLAVNAPVGLSPAIGQAVSSMQILGAGVPNFFQPRWWLPSLLPQQWPANWISLYDTTPVKTLLAKYVDFTKLASSPVRLLVSAVNVETAELEVFDSYRDQLTADHIVASGSLPPGFPWTTIKGKHYWDGGMISNSPLELVIDRCGAAGKRVFIVDLFSARRSLPSNLMEVAARRDEIVYSERVMNDVRTRALVRDFRKLVGEAMGFLDEQSAGQMRQRPRYIQLMGEADALSITRIVRAGEHGEPSSRDYDFARASIEKNQRDGFERALKALRKTDPGTVRPAMRRR